MRPIKNERQLLALIADRNKRYQAAHKAGEPEIGIYFVFNGEVLIDGKPLCVTEPYGKFNCADLEYDHYWKFGQRYGVVPREIEYVEVPRGRVEYDINEKKFHIYADSCVVKDRKALDDVNREFRLPAASTEEPEFDPRYHCSGCIRPKATKERE
jgi:hypothetical protein